MLPDIITTATAKDGARAPIEEAVRGERYQGIADHEECLLYPVHRRERRSSFAHMPKQRNCKPPGESPEHREAKEAWYRYLCREPFFGEIAWSCRVCLRPHIYDLLHGAGEVVMEERLGSGVRPDITIKGVTGEPVALLEFRKSNLSERVRQFAEESGTPLFVIDVLDGESEQATLHNRQRRWYDDVPELDDGFREMALAVESFPKTEFTPIHDSDGNLLDVTLIYDSDEPSLVGLPSPRRGHFLFAHESTLGCDSQSLDRLPPPQAKASEVV